MNKGYLYILCLLFCPVAAGQNLVKNPGFEEYYHLPDLYYEYGRVIVNEYGMDYDDSIFYTPFICKHWHRIQASTLDYFHMNAKNARYDIPRSDRFGYYPALADSAYMGIHPLNLDGRTEPFSGEFTEPLEKGKVYEVSFFYCFASEESYFYSDKIEVHISTDNWITDPYKYGVFLYIFQIEDIAANVVFEIPMSNDGRWHKMTGRYHAKGGEKYISFGIFYQNKRFHKIIAEYQRNNFSWGQNQHKLERFFKKYQKDLFLHRNPNHVRVQPYVSNVIKYETVNGETQVYFADPQLCYYFIDNVSVVENSMNIPLTHAVD